jgi:ectoine hydroxylase-related dioxygenase (phytanoyl-CoA dioxygenase family)
MGERPLLTVTKTTLRRVEPVTRVNWHPDEYGWHQDGVIFGRKARAINLWLALTDCGVDAPGLDLLARRVPYFLRTASHGAWVEYSIGNGLVELLAEGGAKIVSPAFEAGDALLFDPLTVHRSAVRQSMRRTRWAIEAWLLAPIGRQGTGSLATRRTHRSGQIRLTPGDEATQDRG